MFKSTNWLRGINMRAKYVVLPIYLTILMMCQIAISAPTETIRVGTTKRFSNFDPRFTIGSLNKSISDLVHCKLFSYDKNSNLIPQLAKSLPSWSSEKSFSIEIRENFKFSDGKLLTAADISAIYNNTISNIIYPKNSELKNIKSVAASGNKIHFVLHEKDPFIIYRMDLGILPKRSITSEKIKIEITPTCGPYSIGQQTLNRLTLKRNKYFNFKEIKNNNLLFERRQRSELISGLEKGDYHLLFGNFSATEIEHIAQKNPSLKRLSHPSNSTTYIGFNLRNKQLNDVATRNKIAASIKKTDIITIIYGNKAVEADQLFGSNNVFHSKIIPLIGTNHKSSDIRNIIVSTNPEKKNILVAKAIAKSLQSQGILSSVKPVEWGQFKKDILKNKIDIWVLSIKNIKAPDILYKLYHSSQIPPMGLNRSYYTNKQVDRLLEDLLSEISYEKQMHIVSKIQNILAKEMPYFYILHKYNNMLSSKYLKGFDVQADNSLRSLMSSFVE